MTTAVKYLLVYLLIVLTVSLVINLVLVIGMQQIQGNYDRLLVWACNHGNGGAECGEE